MTYSWSCTASIGVLAMMLAGAPAAAQSTALDATASYHLSDAVELRLDGLNLTNVNSYIYYEDPDQKAGNGLSRRDNFYFNGRTIAIGIRGKF